MYASQLKANLITSYFLVFRWGQNPWEYSFVDKHHVDHTLSLKDRIKAQLAVENNTVIWWIYSHLSYGVAYNVK